MRPIDVMLPAFNAASTIAMAIASLQRQTHSNLRVIVVDDGSTDATARIVREIAEADARVVLLQQENQGIVGARNRALSETTSDYITQLDADDISEPDRIEMQAAYLDATPDCVAVSGASRNIDAAGQPTGEIVRFGSPMDADPYRMPAREPLQLPFVMWRRLAVMQAGGYREVGFGEDMDLAWRLTALGAVVNLDRVVGAYRIHASSTGSDLATSRFLAVSTQRVAISAQRRLQSLPDLAFSREEAKRCRALPGLQPMYELAVSGMNAAEAAHLRIASAAKMLQWLELRRHEPDIADAIFIREAYEAWLQVDPEGAGEARRLYSVIGARLLRSMHFRKAKSLLPNRLLPVALIRTALNRC